MRTSTTALAALLALTLPFQALASEPIARSQQSEPDTLFHDIESGGYGAPVLKYSKVGTSDGLFVGGRGGWIINHSFVLGGAGYGLATNYALPGDRLTFGYGGVMLEYIVESDALLHLAFDTVIGGGAVAPKSSTSPNGVFVVEPELDGIVNLTRSLRAGLGVSYRFTRGVHVASLNDGDLSGVNGTVFLEFGAF